MRKNLTDKFIYHDDQTPYIGFSDTCLSMVKPLQKNSQGLFLILTQFALKYHCSGD
jgi:hypothetical protein